MQDKNEEINSILKKAKSISDKKTVDIFKEHITKKDYVFDLDLSSLNLSTEEEDRIICTFLVAL